MEAMNLPSFLTLPGGFLLRMGLLLCTVIASQGAPLVSFMPPGDWPPSTDWYQASYGSPTVSTASINGHEWMSIARDTSTVGSQLVYTAGFYTDANLPTPTSENQLSDFTGQVILAASGWTAAEGVGVILRSRVSSFAGTESYFLAMNNDSLSLFWGVGTNFVTNATVLASTPLNEALTTLANGGEYLLSFSALGNTISASLYASWTMDEDGNPVGSPIASLSYTDLRPEARTSGYFALRGGRLGSNGRTVYFRDLEIHAIPEPSVTSLGVAGIALAAGTLLMRSRASRQNLRGM